MKFSRLVLTERPEITIPSQVAKPYGVLTLKMAREVRESGFVRGNPEGRIDVRVTRELEITANLMVVSKAHREFGEWILGWNPDVGGSESAKLSLEVTDLEAHGFPPQVRIDLPSYAIWSPKEPESWPVEWLLVKNHIADSTWTKFESFRGSVRIS